MWEHCSPGAVHFIEQHFRDCVYTTPQLIGFCLGLASIALWITAQLPQFIDNYRRQSAEALSVWFLAQWFLGDTLNLLGALLNGQQLATTVMLACYFVLSDVVMLCQFLYYTALQRQRDAYARRMRAKALKHGGQGSHSSNHHHHHHSRHHTGGLASGQSSSHRIHSSSTQLGSGEPSIGPIIQPALLLGSSGGGASGDAQATLTGTFARTSASSSPFAAYAGVPAPVEPPSHGPIIQGQQQQGGPTAGKMVIAAVVSASALSLGFMGTAAVWQGGLHAPPASDPKPVLPQGAAYTSQQSGRLDPDHRQQHHQQQQQAASGSWLGGTSEKWEEWEQVLGTAFGFAAALLYLGSRVSQIWKNWSRKSAEGLSVAMFCFTIAANTCTGSSILLRVTSWEQVNEQLPWVLSAFGTVLFDVVIFRQALVYGRAQAEAEAAEAAHHHHHHHHHRHRSKTHASDQAGVQQPLLESA